MGWMCVAAERAGAVVFFWATVDEPVAKIVATSAANARNEGVVIFRGAEDSKTAAEESLFFRDCAHARRAAYGVTVNVKLWV